MDRRSTESSFHFFYIVCDVNLMDLIDEVGWNTEWGEYCCFWARKVASLVNMQDHFFLRNSLTNLIFVISRIKYQIPSSVTFSQFCTETQFQLRLPSDPTDIWILFFFLIWSKRRKNSLRIKYASYKRLISTLSERLHSLGKRMASDRRFPNYERDNL